MDQTENLQQAVIKALQTKTPLNITGGGSKAFYGRAMSGTPLLTTSHCGIIDYPPSELVVTARAGTPLAELEQILAEQGQMLGFEPPHAGTTDTLGGVIACGWSGSRRAFTGSARDFVLGCRVINGNGEVLKFGGEVIKNVAGYDVSRLMVGALGTLGVLLDISLKVLPLPACEFTVGFELPVADALTRMNVLAGQPWPLSGLAFDGRLLRVRLAGHEQAVRHCIAKLGGEVYGQDPFWSALNHFGLDFFQTELPLWRIVVPPAMPPLALSGDWLYDWGGGLRWLRSDEPPAGVFGLAEQMQGHATLFRNGNRNEAVFQPLTGKLHTLNQAIKHAFDPHGLFNPQRMALDW